MKHNNHTFIDSETFEIIPDSKIIEVHNEIIKYNKLLVKWANNLPDINERTDKYE